MKNKKLYAFLGLSFAVALASCSDDEIVKSNPAEKGAEVNFGAALENPRSRTYYGEQNGNAFPIYWNEESKGFDKIFIYAPKALTGRNQCYYTVHPNADDRTAPAPVVKIGTTGVQWGTEATPFYGFYPGNENFNINVTGTNTVSATLPADQTITFDYKLDVNSTDGHQFETNPDMSCVMMVAKTADLEPTTDAVGLKFEPLSTVIDVTVNGPEAGNLLAYYVTSVALVSDKQICGEFEYDFANGTVKPLDTDPVANGTNSITVRTMGLDSQGNYVGVPLRHGQKLNLKISMLPYTDVSNLNLKVQVTTVDSKIWTKSLATTHLGAGQINPVELPPLKADGYKLDYSRWMSQLDPRIYISELSIPGSALAFNIKGYMASGNETQCTQLGTLDQQFAAGSRIFQGHFWMIPGESPIDHKEGQFVITTSNGNSTGISLMHACERLQQEMQRSHSHGFCILMLSDYSMNGTSYSLSQVYERFQDVSAELQNRNILAPDITPTTTLADVRGKIILKLQLNGRDIPYNTGLTVASTTNNALTSLQTVWSELAISGTEQTKALFNLWNAYAADHVYYSPLTFGQIGTFTFDGASHGWGYNRAVIHQTSPGIAVEAAKLWASNASTLNTGNLNAPRPTDVSELAQGMWYIYNEEASARSNISQCQTNITDMLAAIKLNYTGTYYNKFFMTYVGGTGSNYGESVKNDLNPHWYTQSESASQVGENYPLGWVLFNDVTDHFTSGTTSTQKCMERVINQNTKSGFILERDRSATITPAAAPTGDTQGTKPGGSPF